MKFLAIGPMCWGSGTEIEAAVKRMKKECPRVYVPRGARSYNVFEVDEETYVNDMGGLSWMPNKPEPKLVKKVRDGKEIPIDHEQYYSVEYKRTPMSHWQTIIKADKAEAEPEFFRYRQDAQTLLRKLEVMPHLAGRKWRIGTRILSAAEAKERGL